MAEYPTKGLVMRCSWYPFSGDILATDKELLIFESDLFKGPSACMVLVNWLRRTDSQQLKYCESDMLQFLILSFMNKIQRPRKKTHALQFIHCFWKFFYIISSLFNLYFCLNFQFKFTLCIVTMLGNHIFKHAVNDNEKKKFCQTNFNQVLRPDTNKTCTHW